MFYFFHHMPKCGGTSFNTFLRSLFTVHRDYHVGNQKSHPKAFLKYQKAPMELGGLGPHDCVAGHYNLPGIHLWERYPDLSRHDVRLFSILRDPYETAESGIRFGMKRGWYNPAMGEKQKTDLLMRRASFISTTLGVKEEGQISEVLNRYWFVAPLTRIDQAAQVVERDVGRSGASVERVNTTEPTDTGFSEEAQESFREHAAILSGTCGA